MQTDQASLSGATFCITVDEHVANSVRSSEQVDRRKCVTSSTVDEQSLAAFAAIDVPWQNFLSSMFGTVSQRSTVIFKDTRISYQHSAGQVEGSPDAKISSMRWAVSIELRLVTDTDRLRHKQTTAASTSEKQLCCIDL